MMDNMKKIISIFILAVMAVSCSFLDYNEYSGYDKDDVYESFDRVQKSLTHIYSHVPTAYSTIDGAMRAAACDEAIYVNNLCSIYSMNDGSWSASKTFDTRYGLYSAIRSINLFLEETKGEEFDYLKNLEAYENYMAEFENYPYEARFLRAYYYFELMRRYKEVPIITEVLNEKDANTLTRNSLDDVVEFIVSECEVAQANLPVSFEKEVSQEVGRATKGAAMALKARTLLYAASPLFNEDGDKAKWKTAAKACAALINKADEYGYMPLPKLSNLWNKNYELNNELIFGRMEAPANSFESQNFPVGIDGGGSTGHCPTQNLVEAFETTNGKPVKDTKYSSADPTYDENNPYENRDPRLNATIAVNNSNWVYNEPVEIWYGGKSGKPVKHATLTGYYLKKYVDGTTSLKAGNTSKRNHVWTYFRYGEVLLNYAEAMVEGYGDINYKNPPSLPLSALEAVNIIRKRKEVNMPDFDSGMSTAQFKEKLRNERMVELAFEDHRFWDIRRWMIGDQTTDIYGVEITKDKMGFNYKKVLVESRIWDDKMYLYPIPDSEIHINSNLGQNPGW